MMTIDAVPALAPDGDAHLGASYGALDDAQRFLRMLAPDQAVTFQTFDDGPQKRNALARILHGRLDAHVDRLTALNQRGAGVFVTVNGTDGKGRRRANITEVRAVFVDLDGAPIDPVRKAPLTPHLIVESSPGRYHAYWLVDGIALDEFTHLQEALARRYHGDPSVKDLPRVMRLPGFKHNKKAPYTSAVVQLHTAARYGREEFLTAFAVEPTDRQWNSVEPITEGRRNDTLFRQALGFVGKGYPSCEIFDRLAKVNRRRCEPPLPLDELQQIVEQAAKYPPTRSIQLPLALMTSPRFLQLSHGATALYLRLRVIADDDPCGFTMPITLMTHYGFGNPKTLAKYRDELKHSGLLKQLSRHRCGTAGVPRVAGRYRLIA